MRPDGASELFSAAWVGFAHRPSPWTDDPGQQFNSTMRAYQGGVGVAPGHGGNKGEEPTAMGGMTENEDLALAA